MVAGWNHLTANLLLATLMLFGRRFAVWTDTPDVGKRRPWPWRILRAGWLRWVFAKADRIMGTGRAALNALRVMGADQRKLVNLPYFVDVARYRMRQSAALEGRPLRFISSGRLNNEKKGHDLALRALVKASDSTRVPFEYTIAGVGPDEQALRELAKRLGVEEQLKLPGWLEPEELIDLMQNSDVLLHPSPTHEPYGVAILEGMACGLPVLASDVCGAAVDRIESGVNGCVHHAGNVDELAEQIAGLLSAPERVRDMGGMARTTAQEWPIERGVSIIRDICLGQTQINGNR
ncbi:MAG: glycosyltransferase family 4 protein [Chromatiales bacterium]|nr:glycosyltransferase family 4 protein [Chromatiales bacterium]